MGITLHLQALRKTKWSEFVLRFIFGGAISVIAAILAERFGPAFGGLFLAFPAIFPASATLVEKHERQKKARAGIPASQRGRQSAALDAAGAALGSIGLFGFAIIVWKFLPRHNIGLVLLAATTAWLALSVLAWDIRRKGWRRIAG
jgi:succinate-acetate transporter protein